MRWEAFFADMEARLAAEEAADADAEIAERARAEAGSVQLLDRMRAQVGQRLTLRSPEGGVVRGRLAGVGADVVLLADAASSVQVLVPVHAIATVAGLGRASAREDSPVRSRIGLRTALRELARSREPVVLGVAGGEVAGLVQRVGADHLDVRAIDDGIDATPRVLVVATSALRSVRTG